MTTNPGNAARRALAARRRAYAVQLRSMRRTYQQIADAVLPCPQHADQGGIDPARCAELHRLDRMVDPSVHPIDCATMYANRKGAQRAVEEALEEGYQIDEGARDTLRREQLATIDTLLNRTLRDALGAPTPADRARATTAATRLLERAARLTGLDAPTRVTVTDELDDELRAALQELAETPAPETLREL